ncbi:MAG: hydrogenase [Candidatus Binatia bacterium]|nr:MAG: hydrogenase [Candidatus Binatia bacterium]
MKSRFGMKPTRGTLRKSAGKLAPGKVPRSVLEELFRLSGERDPRVLVGAGFGVDAAVVGVGNGRVLVLKSDPVTFTEEEAGWYAVHVNANDIAVMGARPRWFQPTILLPPGTTREAVRSVAREIHRAAKSLGIAVTGGHTEVTPAVRQIVVAGDMQGTALRRELVTPARVRPGDALLLVGSAALEGTSILARRDFARTTRLLGARGARRAARFHRVPGISVVAPALLCARAGASGMHDATEGGVAMALYEFAEASGVRFVVDLDRIPVREETRVLCGHYGLDPLRLLSSGALLVAVPAERCEKVAGVLERRGYRVGRLGSAEKGRGVRATRAGKVVPFRYSERDELARLDVTPRSRTAGR